MKIFVAQINPVVGDLEGNARKILNISSKAFTENADLLITPELSLWGYPPKDLLLKNNLIQKQWQILDDLSSEISKNYGDLSLILGIAEPAKDCFFPNLYNSMALLENGKWKSIARKTILPSYEVFDERRYFKSEQEVSVLKKEIKGKTWKIGLTICEDLWVNINIDGRGIHKKNPIIDLKKEKIDLLINLSASPFTFNKIETRYKVASSAADHLKTPLIYVNQVGGNDDLVFDGNSFIFNKEGRLVKKLKSFKEDFYCWDIEDQKLEFNIYENPSEVESIFNALVLGVKDYSRKCGFKTALIGLSGGIDSALVTVIATAALGKENVYCIAMPSKWNSPNSRLDAKELANNLNVSFETMPINDLLESFENTFKDNLQFKLVGLTNENIQSRIRGTILMALANHNNHLLLSTGNKSELAVGYCTLYGDMNGGLSVIGDLYKTNVFKLCNWLDSQLSDNSKKAWNLPTNKKIIGERILKKPPSAELGPNQLDTDSLPPYSILDIILKGIIEDKKDLKELQEEGHKLDLIIKIISLIKNSEFKRKQAPPILKLSSQSLGNDWRLPIAISKR